MRLEPEDQEPQSLFQQRRRVSACVSFVATMSFSGMERLRPALFLVSAAGVAVALPLFLAGTVEADAYQESMKFHSSSVTPAAPRECGAGQRDGDLKTLELTAKKGEPLEFKCGASLILNPDSKSGKNFDKIFSYASGQCNTSNQVLLAEQVTGATLKQKGEGSDLPRGSDPVYIFEYSSEQGEEKHLCYTCNTTNPKAYNVRTVRGSTISCTVHITVPKDPATNPSTPPASGSDARAVRAAVAAVIGGFVALTLCL